MPQAAIAPLALFILEDKAIAPKPKKTTAQKQQPLHKIHSLVMKALEQEKAEDVVSIDLAGKTAIADHMVIVTGRSSRHVIGIAENLRDRLAKDKIKARVEGVESGDWVIVDAVDVIVHIFRAEVREFYNLEKLWGTDFSAVDYTLYKSG